MKIEYFPFSEQFKVNMLLGNKTKTSRNKKYGNAGDTFKIFGETFTITEIKKEKLDVIKNKYYREEGFFSPIDFENIWIKLHPRKGWEPDKLVFVHSFKKGKINTGQRKL